MVELNNLSPRKGSRRKKTRLGLGNASGKGRSCAKGQKGQTSRSGNTRKESKEGGQMPLFRRIPKSGFSNARFAFRYECVNIKDLAKFSPDTEVTPRTLREHKLIKCASRVKILGEGELKSVLTVKAHSFSSSAKKKIESAGGKAIVVGSEKDSQTKEV